jgi:catechol 2,3-dioxygenase-like lactoylglutathione lyase family enzyme
MAATLNHISIIVQDLEKTRDFFVKYFGFTAGQAETLKGPWADELNRMRDVAVTHIPITLSGQMVELQKFDNPPSPRSGDNGIPNYPGYRHIGFKVDDIDALCTQLKTDGWELLSDVLTVPEMKLKTVYFYGPEKILVHLMQPI